ncbi:GntR family transcriptional regulator, transcriptional repressor for pyruvate dehydrogenase complex/GntR family transcriptional regulator, glc operon transcriptional activator [Devosia crocina]|uniref:GntR family transcriptional regulator, transcriptional repressor for pyruvate dehydrogenase complex/GntR family transcriptional regulator, glc operon transcriptional activator n=1 Tax=Devosia crocina TaxID=429728 RepID=A0A1I7N3V9_9HYPH|nr:FadR/GntR family transcriptional regulator [Devosia crocina]SFV29348.1 GntR family transcriptional regulator, transcriptional repressor for pyruvate dehydrogenase complex/GntR family transcriptional regulator, glc operon transcriptional activator [Devosia crocina]
MTGLAGEGRSDSGSAASAVADDLAKLILGELVPGQTLPSEAELAERYAVSRLTIREAVKLLAGRGLLELSRGRKAVVREPDGSAFTDFLTSIIRTDPKGLFDLVEVRLSLEVQSATLAAKRANRAGIVAIENALHGMLDCTPAGADFADEAAEARFHQFDFGFHEAVALASGNRVLGYLFEAMASPMRDSLFISQRGHAFRGNTPRDTIIAHQRILDCIRDGNGRAAADAMRMHLRDTERDIRMAVSKMSFGAAKG